MPPTDPSAADGSVAERPRDAHPSSSSTGHPAPPPSPRTFPREARLLDGRAYDAVFGDNRRVADRFWTVLAHRPPGGGSLARLGLAIAKKRAKRAVDRNRIKRVARESFRHARHALGDHHVVIMNRDAATSASADELRAALDALWSRLLRQSPERDGRRNGKRTSGERDSGKGSSGARAAGSGRSAGDVVGPLDVERQGDASEAGGVSR